jgi:2,4-dienoyl-CoA reductase
MSTKTAAAPLPEGTYKGRVVLITGGGTGLGLACAKKFAALGAKGVVITGRREAVLQKSKAEIEAAASGTKVLAIAMDVRQPDSVKAGVDRIEQEFGQPPCVVLNNAAGNFVSPSERLSPNAWKTIIDIVLMGTIHVTGDVAKRWIARRPKGVKATDAGMQPEVVFMQVGASYVERGQPFLAPSSAAKSAVLNLTQSLSVEWGKYNIRLWMISPGPIYTEGAFNRLDPSGAFTKKADALLPMQRMGSTEEYANFVTFGCSHYGSWLSGTNIYFDGAAAAAGGEFSPLRDVPMSQWDLMERMIRSNNDKSKGKAKL